jgi:AraC-like DNA-binding protein
MNQAATLASRPPRNGYAIVHLRSEDNAQISIRKDEIAVILAMKGQITYYWRSKVHQVGENAGVIVNQSGVPQIFSLDNSFRGILFTLNQMFVQRILSAIHYIPNPDGRDVSLSQLAIPNSDSIQVFLQSLEIYARFAHFNQDQSILESKLTELFWLLNNSESKENFDQFISPFQVPDRTFLDSILEKHFRENISLSELSTIAGYSVSTFKRKFEETYNCSPGKWIQRRRLMEARYLLEVTNKTISEICYEVGFENPSHFIQAFKQKFGNTPKRLQHNRPAA